MTHQAARERCAKRRQKKPHRSNALAVLSWCSCGARLVLRLGWGSGRVTLTSRFYNVQYSTWVSCCVQKEVS